MKDKSIVFGAWIGARLQRAKRIPAFKRLWQRSPGKARILSPDETAEQKARHEALIKQLTPDLQGKK